MKLAQLQSLRKQRKWTQREAAIHLGISYSYYTKIESGQKSPTLKLARKMVSTFNATSIEEIIGTEAS